MWLKIAFVTETWLPSADGVVTRLVATIRALRADGHEILVIAPGSDASMLDGVIVRTVPSVGFPGIYGGKPWGIPLPRVSRMLREFAPDVVHVVNPVLLGIVGVATARRRGMPLVASYHTDVAQYAGYYRLGWLRPVIWWLLRLLHNKAAVNLVTSGAARTQLQAQRIRRVRLWRRGVDLELFHPAPEPPPRDDTPTALYVGRLAAEKDLHRLAVLAEADSGVRLMLVGDGPSRHELERQLGATVTFTGTLRGDELAAAYAGADVFVFPSTSETLGLVLLEALASGLPIVAAESPASNELLSDCAVARLFPADSPQQIPKLVHELADTADRTAARREAEQWGWPVATAELVHYYQSAVHAVRAPRSTPTWRQFAAFLTVGGLNAVVDVFVFNALLTIAPTSTSSTLALYNTIAVVAAIANSYWFNSRWTFHQRSTGTPAKPWRRRMAFLLQALLNIAVNDAVVIVFAGVFGGVGGMPNWVGNNLAKLLAMAAASVASFLLMRRWVFTERRT